MQLIKRVPKQARQKTTKHMRMFFVILMKGERIMNENNNKKIKQKVMSRITEIKFANTLSSISSIVVIITSIFMCYVSMRKPDKKQEYDDDDKHRIKRDGVV